MKKNIASLLLSAAALTLLAGCNKEQVAGNDMPSQKTFKASIENNATKTTLNRTGFGGKIEWTANDVIIINEPGIQYKATPCIDNPTIAEFKAEGAEASPIDGMYYAWYPYTLVQMVNGEPAFVLNKEFIYKGNEIGLMYPMYAESSTTDLKFKNLCGLLEITLKGSKAIDRIIVSDAEKALSGAFTIDENNNAVIADNSTKATMTLLCKNAKLTESGVSFYLPVPPATYSQLKIKVFSADGYSYEATARTAATIERSTIYPLEFTPDLGNNVHEGVQLWENGPEWATTNIGASTPTETGLFFRWGEQSGQRLVVLPEATKNYYDGEEPYRNYNSEATYKHAYDFSSLDLTGANIDQDAARALWGDGWRMPTLAEINKLSSLNPTIEAVMEGETTVGYKVTTAMGSVTFAVSGYYGKTSPDQGINSSSSAHFWTSTPKTVGGSHDVNRVNINTSGISTKTNREYMGLCIRPVRDVK